MPDRFANPWAFALVLLLAPALWSMARAAHARLALPTPPEVVRARPTLRTRTRWIPGLLRLAAIALLIVAIARPQDVSGQTKTSTEGIAIELVLDRSSSMDEPVADNAGPTRKIDMVKSVLEDFVTGGEGGLKGRDGDMIGLISFARYADTVCPLVRNHETLVELANDVDIVTIRSEDGTAIGEAIALAAARLRKAEEETQRLADTEENPEFTIKGKVIVLLTDGVNNQGAIDPLQAARLAAEWGIRIYTIGIGGGQRYVTMQGPFGDRRVPVGSSLDENALRAIADATGGQYFAAGDERSLREVYAQIDRLEKTEINTVEYTNVDERFGALAIGALLAGALEFFLACTLFRRVP